MVVVPGLRSSTSLCLQIARLEQTWMVLRQRHTEGAILYEKKLKPFLKSLNEGKGEQGSSWFSQAYPCWGGGGTCWRAASLSQQGQTLPACFYAAPAAPAWPQLPLLSQGSIS